ncbi:MAG: DNA cytosine methyltransferase [Methanococcoides sp.]|nr:DNA cytosine methyltransferase [Methanococcoides sp.]
MEKTKLKVADFFCGGGGFSEGFRQNDLDIVFALDHWQPAIDTHHLNHPDCNTVKMDILELDTPEKIDEHIPDVDVIIGSPPCVSFSGSNNAGKADKTLGIKLIESYLRIVAWKKYKKGGVLKYWILENVPNAGKYIKDKYTWKELGLPGEGPDLKMEVSNVFNAADYGAPQARKRFMCGEFPAPVPTCKDKDDWLTMKEVMHSLGNPLEGDNGGTITDPNYGFSIASNSLTDHFYDTRVADFEWKKAKRMKEDHGFMGKMSFPENLDRPSRTVMATRSASTRESMIFEAIDENGKHIGYRLPTIREIASMMSFPITYQFQAGNESSKYRLVGNAVCAKLSSALAKAILEKENIEPPMEFIPLPATKPSFDLTGTKIELKDQKDKMLDAKFAIHIPYIKIRGFRVELTNKNSDFKSGNIKWSCVLHQGSGKNATMCSPEECDLIGLVSEVPKFDDLINDVKSTFDEIDTTSMDLQKAYVSSCQTEDITPEMALQKMRDIIDAHFPDENAMVDNSGGNVAINREKVPLRIVAGLYACDHFVKQLK